VGISNITDTTTLFGLDGDDYDIPFLDRVIIVVVILAVFVGLIGLFAGKQAAAITAIFVLGYFTKTNFLTYWVTLPSMIAFIFIFLWGDKS
jgi:hypothetical protein